MPPLKTVSEQPIKKSYTSNWVLDHFARYSRQRLVSMYKTFYAILVQQLMEQTNK